jgi:hypothetical protein
MLVVHELPEGRIRYYIATPFTSADRLIQVGEKCGGIDL